MELVQALKQRFYYGVSSSSEAEVLLSQITGDMYRSTLTVREARDPRIGGQKQKLKVVCLDDRYTFFIIPV